MKGVFANRKPGFYLAAAAALLALISVVAYVIIYMATAAEEVDRVFSWFTFGMILAGALIALAGEILRLRIAPVLAGVCLALGLANHVVEFAYPLADVLTGVPFFGGNYPLALAFVIAFGAAAVLNVIASFLEHNKT